MSGFFNIGETKVRPGIYKRYENESGPEIAGAREGVACAVVSGNWGAVNTPVVLAPGEDIRDAIGYGSGNEVVKELFAGGTQSVIVVRVGGGTQETQGTCGTASATSGSGDTTVTMTITAKYPGARAFTLTVKTDIDDESVKTYTLYDGTRVVEQASFAAGGNEFNAFKEAIAESKHITASVSGTAAGTFGATATFTIKGTDPTPAVASYSEALEAAESQQFSMLVTDSNDNAVHLLVDAFLDRIYQDGAYTLACVAEDPDTVALDTRMAHAASFNDYKVIYVLNGWVDSADIVHKGYVAAARIAGMICSSPSDESLTRSVITNAVSLTENLTNTQIKKALQKGCLLVTKNRNDQIWIEQAINTLVTLGANEDAGWKKIRRTKERFELMQRIDDTLEPLVGIVDNDEDGRGAVIAAAQRVIDEMVGEKKLLDGEIIEDEGYPPQGDSAWFIIGVDDLDSLEKLYFDYKFRFAPELTTEEA